MGGLGIGDSGGSYRFKNSCSRTDDIYASKLFFRNMEHTLQMLPVGDIGLLENGLCRGTGVIGDQLLGFGPKLQVSEDDIASLTQ